MPTHVVTAITQSCVIVRKIGDLDEQTNLDPAILDETSLEVGKMIYLPDFEKHILGTYRQTNYEVSKIDQ